MQNEGASPPSLRIVPVSGDEAVVALSGGVPAVARRPLLRGRSHALAAIGALCCTALLWHLAEGDRPKQLALLVYGLSNALLYGISALYHIGTWSRRWQALFRRLDHATIFIMLAGCYTPVAVTMLSGWWRVSLLGVVWALAAAGMISVAGPRPVPRHVRIVLYLMLGWIAVLLSPVVSLILGPQDLLLPALSGALSTVGALIYAFRRPALWPRVFGYHELFHLVSIAASATFFVFVLQYVVPYVRP